MTAVSIVRDENVESAVRRAVDLIGGIGAFVKPRDKIMIKPNLTTALPSETGLTTDPRVVEALIELCMSRSPAEIIIAEGSGGAETTLAFERCGYSQLAEKHGVDLVDLNKSSTRLVSLREGVFLREISVPEVILECDVLINVPKLKLRKNWVTLSVKNLLGALPGKGRFSGEIWTPEAKWFRPEGEKKRVHGNLAEGLVDINTLIRPALNVMDGIVASYENRPVRLNAVLAGRDPLALDCVATRIGGLDYSRIQYLKCAAERRLGEADVGKIKILGTPLEEMIEAWQAALSGTGHV
jgi:uncharacterized protein (DUF362 family)